MTVSAKDTKHRLARRIVALVAAYAIALSALVGGIVTARAAVAAVTGNAAITICHTDTSSNPADDGTSVNHDCCDLGCLALATAIPAPSGDILLVLRTSSHVAQPFSAQTLSFERTNHPQQSRAPPQAA
jgi:hypothetical protein